MLSSFSFVNYFYEKLSTTVWKKLSFRCVEREGCQLDGGMRNSLYDKQNLWSEFGEESSLIIIVDLISIVNGGGIVRFQYLNVDTGKRYFWTAPRPQGTIIKDITTLQSSIVGLFENPTESKYLHCNFFIDLILPLLLLRVKGASSLFLIVARVRRWTQQLCALTFKRSNIFFSQQKMLRETDTLGERKYHCWMVGSVPKISRCE